MRKKVSIILFVFLCFAHILNSQQNNFIISVENETFVSDTSFMFDVYFTNTGSTNFTVQGVQLRLILDKAFKKGNYSHSYIVGSQFSVTNINIGDTVTIESRFNESDLLELNRYFNTAQNINPGVKLLYVRVQINNPSGFNQNQDPLLRFKFKSPILTNAYSLSTCNFSDANNISFFGYSELSSQYSNLDKGISAPEPPKNLALFSPANSILRGNFQKVTKNNGYFTGNYDSSAIISGYHVQLIDSATQDIVSDFVTTDSFVNFQAILTGTYRFRVSSINVADSSLYSSFSNYFSYVNHNFIILSQSVPQNSVVFSPAAALNVLANTSQKISYQPSADNLQIDSIVVDGTKNTDSLSQYTFNSVVSNHRLKVYTSIKKFRVRLVVNGAGSANWGGANPILSGNYRDTILLYGQNLRLFFTPNINYFVTSLSLAIGNNPEVILTDSIESYTISNITDDIVATINFNNVYTVTATVLGANGIINNPSTVMVSKNGMAVFNVTPNNGYRADTVLLNGNFNQVALGNTITISGIIKNSTAQVKFNPIKVQKPLILNVLKNQYINQGSSASFSVNAVSNDAGVLSYRWYQKYLGSTTYNIISGQQTSTYSTIVSQLDSGSIIRVVVYSAFGIPSNIDSSISEAQVLVLGNPLKPVITQFDTVDSVIVNNSIKFNVQAITKDAGILTYIWQKKVGLADQWVYLNNDPNSNYFVYTPSEVSESGVQFRVLVYNTINNQTVADTSNILTLTVLSQPESFRDKILGTSLGGTLGGIVILGGSALILGVAAAWLTWGLFYTFTTLLSAFAAQILGFAGVVTAVAAVGGTVILVSGYETNWGHELNKDPKTQYDSPRIYVHPVNTIGKPNGTALFYVSAQISDGGTLKYQWQVSTNGGNSYTNIANATDSIYKTPILSQSYNNNLYRVIVSNYHGNTHIDRTSNSGKLIIDNSANFVIETGASIGGYISAPQSIPKNGNATITFNPAPGYYVYRVEVDGKLLSVVPPSNQYSFTNVTSSHIIFVYFELKVFNINVKILDDLGSTAQYTLKTYIGSSYRVFFPKLAGTKFDLAGYSLGNGFINKDSMFGYTFYDIESDQDITIYLINKKVNINIYSKAPQHNDTLVNSVSVYYQDTVRVRYIFDTTKFIVDSVYINGVYNRDSTENYTFYKIMSDQNIKIVLKPKQYNLNITKLTDSNNYEKIISTFNSTIPINGSYRISLLPDDPNLYLDSFLINGISIYDSSIFYTISYPTQNLDIILKYKNKNALIISSIYLNGVKLKDVYYRPSFASNYRVLFYNIPYSNLVSLDSINVNKNVYKNYALDSTQGFTFYNITTQQTIQQFYKSSSSFFFINYKNQPYNTPLQEENIPVLLNDTVKVNFATPNFNLINDSVNINGIVNKDSLNSYTFYKVSNNNSIFVRQAVKKVKVIIKLKTFFPDGSLDLVEDSINLNYNSNFTFSYNSNTGYKINGIYLNYDYSNNYFLKYRDSFTLFNIKSDVVLEANFASNSYYINTNSNVPNSIGATTTVFYNKNIRIPFLFDKLAYTIDSLVVNNQKVVISDTATGINFNNVSADQDVNLYLKPIKFSITGTQNEGGLISGDSLVNYGTSYTFYSLPYYGYYIDSLIITHSNGLLELIKLPMGQSYTINSVFENLNLRVVFKPLYTINIQSNDSVNIKINKVFNSGTNSYLYNDNFSITNDTILYFPVNDTVNLNLNSSPSTSIDSLIVDGINIIENPIKTYNFRFINLSSNRSFRIVANSLYYRFSAVSDTNGTIIPAGDSLVRDSDSIRYYFIPKSKYKVDSVWVDGVYSDSLDGVTFKNVHAAHTIQVKFTIGKYRVLTSSSSGGIISDTLTVYRGDSARVTYQPNNGYQFENITINNNYSRFDSNVGYTFRNIRGDSTIAVNFEFSDIVISASAGLHGKIIPSGDTTINTNSNIGYKFMADSGYYVDSVYINGMNDSTLIDTFTFYKPKTNQAIRVHFSAIPSNKVLVFLKSSLGGTIKPIGTRVLDSNSNLQISFLPNKGNSIDSLIINDTTVVKDSLQSYTFYNLRFSQKFLAQFDKMVYAVNTVSDSNGYIDASNRYLSGSKVVVNYRPNKGYEVDSVFINNAYLLNSYGTRFYTIDSIYNNYVIRVKYKLLKYLIQVVQPLNGSISPSSDSFVSNFDTVFYTISANAGYYVDSILVNGVLQPTYSELILENISSNRIISAIIKPNPVNGYRISIKSNFGGNILPRVGQFFVPADTSLRIRIDTLPGYRIDSITLNGMKIDSTTSFSIDTVRFNYDFVITFKKITFPITTISNLGGTIAASTTIGLYDTVRITYNALNNYFIDSILVNGKNYADSNLGYTFFGVDTAQTIRVVFSNIGNKVLNIKAFIEGYEDGDLTMRPVLLNSNNSGCNNCPNNPLYADSVEVWLISPLNEIVYYNRAILRIDGSMYLNLGNNFSNGNYYILLKGRNTVKTWSSVPIVFNSRNTTYDFTTSASKSYGNNQVLLANGLYALYSGLIFSNNLEISLDDVLRIKNGIELYQQGYLLTDINGDGVITNDDLLICIRNFDKLITTLTPFN
ncbi:MAG: hypothetical protein QM539_02110 [Alphaproteobacteria bacterium]|nr:hypothetical protein [Alphaproteobacteria bacterium]